jgi:hypothetical protein
MQNIYRWDFIIDQETDLKDKENPGSYGCDIEILQESKLNRDSETKTSATLTGIGWCFHFSSHSARNLAAGSWLLGVGTGFTREAFVPEGGNDGELSIPVVGVFCKIAGCLTRSD